jgi:hypothetical protein
MPPDERNNMGVNPQPPPKKRPDPPPCPPRTYLEIKADVESYLRANVGEIIPTWDCEYCGSIGHSKRCDECGAPQPREKKITIISPYIPLP